MRAGEEARHTAEFDRGANDGARRASLQSVQVRRLGSTPHPSVMRRYFASGKAASGTTFLACMEPQPYLRHTREHIIAKGHRRNRRTFLRSN